MFPESDPKSPRPIRLRLGLFLWWFQVGGTEQHALRLARALDPERFQVEIICYKPTGALAESFRDLGLPIHALRRGSRWSLLLAPLRLWRILRRRRYDVLHCLLAYTLLLGPVVARLARVPRVVTSERNRFDWKLRGPLRWASAWVNRRLVDAIIVNSGSIGRELAQRERLDPSRIHVVPNGLEGSRLPPEELPLETWRARCRQDLCQELGLDARDCVLLGSVASLLPLKDHPTLLRALGGGAGGPRARLILVGDGPERDRLMGLARELGVEQRVEWLGRRQDVCRLMGAFDLLLLASEREGFPNVILEALAAGTPALSTPLPYVDDLEELRPYVRTFAPGDPTALESEVERALADEPWIRQVRSQAPSRVREGWTVAAEAEGHARVYRAEASSPADRTGTRSPA